MATKYQYMAALSEHTAKEITSNPVRWISFLNTASSVYKYPFSDQLMIYAQRPDTPACASMEIWNNKMNRWVNRGAKGIALIDDSGAKPQLKYVFDIRDSKYDSKGLKLTTKAPNSPVHTVLLNWTKVAKRIDQMLLDHRFVTEDDRQHIPAFEKEHLVRSVISFADALPYENSSERDPMLQVTVFQFEAGARAIRPILDDKEQLSRLLSVMEKEAAAIPQDHRNCEYCHQLLGELKRYRDGTFTLFPDPKEPLPAEQKHNSTRETTGQLSLEDFLSNAPEDSPIAEPAGSAPSEEKLHPLRLAAQAEYNDLKEHHPDHLLGFEQHGYYEFYGEDAKIAASVLGFKLLEKELVGGGTVEVTGFRAEEWAAHAHTLWKHGHDVYLAQRRKPSSRDSPILRPNCHNRKNV